MDIQTILCTITIIIIGGVFAYVLNKVTPSSKKYEK